MLKVNMWTDHPSTTTGFANVSRPFADYFMDLGWSVHILGRLSRFVPDSGFYKVFPANEFDQDGMEILESFTITRWPDVFWIIGSPGSLRRWFFGGRRDMGPIDVGAITDKFTEKKYLGINKLFKMVVYMPIEGRPMSRLQEPIFRFIQDVKGKVVCYSPGSRQLLLDTFPLVEPETVEFVYHGLDHANFRYYDEADRNILRKMCGLADKFVVGSVGANKGVKGFPDIINVARIIQARREKDIIFYLHTDAEDPLTGQFAGHDLKGLVYELGLEEYVVFKPNKINSEMMVNSQWIGIARDREVPMAQTLRERFESRGYVPVDPYARGEIFSYYSYMDIMNVCDLYLDLATIEGWGLPIGEAMGCGLPVLGIADGHIRDEVYGNARQIIQPLPERLWAWHSTGALLPRADPEVVADEIIRLKNDSQRREELRRLGFECAGRYKWADSCEKMARIIENVQTS